MRQYEGTFSKNSSENSLLYSLSTNIVRMHHAHSISGKVTFTAIFISFFFLQPHDTHVAS